MTTASTDQHLTVEAVVIRADGRREDLGVIASTTAGTVTVHRRDSSMPAHQQSPADRYRIVLRHPGDEHPNSAWFSWRKTYTFNPEFHDPGYSPLDAARGDLLVAHGEFPDHDARIEILIDNGDDTSSWVAI